MREIKFRAKQINDNNWISGYGVIIGNGFCAIPYVVRGNTYDWKLTTITCDINTLGQYTGLKDKNGKEIYEGDILRSNEYPFNCDGVDNYYAEIVWADNVCGFYRVTHKKPNSTVRGISHGNWSPLVEEDIKSFEIIGNIYDTPELIKEGKK